MLELVEHSLDVNLTGNRVRYRFIDTPILDGISVHETYDHVIILVPTVCSVHRLIFPHPDRFHRQVRIVFSIKIKLNLNYYRTNYWVLIQSSLHRLYFARHQLPMLGIQIHFMFLTIQALPVS